MISDRAKSINPSPTLTITSKIKKLKKQGKNVINLASGELDFDTPLKIKEEAISAINEGFTKYTPSSGILELKEAIAKKLKNENGVEYSIEQIVVSNGAKHAISNVLFSLINPEDEVIIFSPFWVSYPEMVKLSQSKPIIVKFKEKNGFRADFEDLENKITPKTKCIILNSPTNPTGVVWSKDELERLLNICLENKLFLISDEVYEHIVFEKKHISFASLSRKAKELTITIGSVSKSYAMTGWRIGWLAAPIEIAKACVRIQSQQTSNPCSISQRAAVEALKDSSWIIEKKEELKRRRNYLIEGLSRLGLSFVKPQGAFYVFCNISKFGLNSMEFSKKLLVEKLLGVIPGRPFGEDGYIRISFSASFQEIEEGLQRLEEFISSL